uniref:Cytochrome P450 2J6-like n=1 Tax=Nothoprocta perdicaria TaxID=30464 RepID=A0A8C6Z7E0_NOTPE
MVTLIVFVFCLFILQFLKLQWARKSLPPGPVPIPFFGNFPHVSFKVDHNILDKLAKTYGNIYTLWLGHKPVVVLHGFPTVKEGLTTHADDVAGRMNTPFFQRIANGKGIFFSSGVIWKHERRFGIATLRKLGLGNKGIERGIQVEARHLMEFFQISCCALDPAYPIVLAVSNVICTVVFGHRFSLEDETFQKLVKALHFFTDFANSTSQILYDICPWLMRHLPGPQQKVFVLCDFIHSFVRKEIRIHKERGKIDDPEDFIDYYLFQMTENNAMYKHDEDNMVQSVFDLFLGGTETTATTLRWALLYMVAYPDIQEKVQQELDAVLGSSQSIWYEDRKRLPYTHAVVHEIMRFCSIILIGLPRETVRDTTLLGYPVPKVQGSKVTLSCHLLSYVSPVFSPCKPFEFDPGHFLDEEGNFFCREAFLPFSTGFRLCLGEQLARMELFIIFCSLLQTFRFTLPDGVKEADTQCILGSTVQPRPYRVCAFLR